MILLLPNELLKKIFHHLLLADRICLRRVCRRWQEVLQSMLKQQTKLRIVSDVHPSSGRAACFAGAACHSMTEYDRIPVSLFKKMILCNSVPWFMDLMPNLRVIFTYFGMTAQFVRRYSATLECLRCDYIEVDTWKTDFPALVRVQARNEDDVMFGRSCPDVKVIFCWGTWFSNKTNSLFPNPHKNRIRDTHNTLNNIAGSPAATSLAAEIMTDASSYNGDCQS